MSSSRQQAGPSAELGPKPRLGYVDSRLDRATERRSDAAALAKLAKAESTRCYIVAGEAVALKKSAEAGLHYMDPLFTPEDLRDIGGAADMAFLGLSGGSARFAAAMNPAAVQAKRAGAEIILSSLRAIAVQGLVEPDHLPALAEGKALLNWHTRHPFCPNCGAATRFVEGGWRRDCPSCNAQHFPRTDPVVIMLAINGERCLLGRSHRFAAGMWSCLAGYVEPGETIEEAVRRETREETGVTCGKVVYFASQPWPFPTSLMIGCHAEALSQQLQIDHTELDEARWFDRLELASMLARQHPGGLNTPHPIAIAYHLIRAWVEDGIAFA